MVAASRGRAIAIEPRDRPSFRVCENGTVLLFALERCFAVMHTDGDAFKHDHYGPRGIAGYRMIVTLEPTDRIP